MYAGHKNQIKRWRMAGLGMNPLGINFPITINFDGDESQFFDGGWAEAGGLVTNDQIALGGELVVNGDFANWTVDNPDNWIVVNEAAPDPEVCEVGAGEAHVNCGGAGTGFCNLFESATGVLSMRQAVLTVDIWHEVTVDINLRNSGRLRTGDTSNGIIIDHTTTGSKLGTGRVENTSYVFAQVDGGGGDITIDDASAKQITFTSILNALKSQFGLADGFFIELDLNTYTPGTELGIMWNIDDVSNPQNFSLARFFQFAATIRVRVTKNVAGTFTDVATVVQAFTSGQILRIENPTGTNVLDILYNGVSIATPTISDAGIISNTGIALFSTNIANAISQVTIGLL